MTIEMLDALIERLPRLRDNGVTHFSVDPNTGAVSVILAPRPVELTEEQSEGQTPSPYDDGSTYSLPPGTQMPPSFRERLKSATPTVK